ncbi:MAG: DUF3500 domain-containing protein, partial [Propionibacteriaceae bacterium]
MPPVSPQTSREASITSRVVSRRWVLAAMPVVAAGIAGCASTSSSSSSASASSPSAASTATAGGAAAAGGVAALAQAFYQTLSADEQKTVLLDYTLANAKRWSNLPQGLLGGKGMGAGPGASGRPSGAPPSDMPSGGAGAPSGGGMGGGNSQSRVGISLGDLSDAQLGALTPLLKAATGTAPGVGYDEIDQQLNADDYLQAHGGGDTYGRKNFYVAFLGSPQDSGTWELQFGGHHLAVANTYTDGKLAGATPSFRGVEPFTA